MDDLADVQVFLMRKYSEAEHITIGCGKDQTIMELAALVADAAGYVGKIATNPSRPDGTPQKLLDVRKVAVLGWQAQTSLWDGMENTFAWFMEQNEIR